MDALDNSAIILPCFDPTGASIELSWRDLLGHTLIIGSTGSGKTTRLIEPIIDQLIRQRAYSGHYSPLLIFDVKNDTTFEGKLRFALACMGRDSHFRVIAKEGGNCSLDPFSLADSGDIHGIAELLSSAIPRDSGNRYWETYMETLIKHLLLAMQLLIPENDYVGKVEFLRGVLLGRNEPHSYVERLKDLIDGEELDAEPKRLATEAIEALTSWDKLDYRTKSIHQSLALCVLKPLQSALVNSLLAKKRYEFSVSEMFANAQVVLVRLNAEEDFEASRFVFSMLKSACYAKILNREQRPPLETKFAAVIMDEWATAATAGRNRFSDRVALQTLRSKGGAVIAATQSVSAIEQEIGSGETQAILSNFNNVFFMRTRDFATEHFADRLIGCSKTTLGEKRVTTWRDRKDTSHWEASHCDIQREVILPQLLSGTLSGLETGEVIGVIGAKKIIKPHWIAWQGEQIL